MWLDVPHQVGQYQALLNGSALFQESHDPLAYYTCAVAYQRLMALFGRGVPSAYRPARFHLLAGVKLAVLGEAPLPRAADAVHHSCEAILNIMRQPALAQALFARLESCVLAVLGSDDPSTLRQLVRTQQFTDRFRTVVLQQIEPHRAAA